jgi:hypothetical protein
MARETALPRKPTSSNAARARRWAPVLLPLVVLLWAGMVTGISFLEAWVKFQAPSITLDEGLDVGRHVFGALNLVEIAWALIVAGLVTVVRPPRGVVVALAIAVAVVALQSAWLLPVLDDRIEERLAGSVPESSAHHVLYIVLEVVKLAALLTAGSRLLARRLAPDG